MILIRTITALLSLLFTLWLAGFLAFAAHAILLQPQDTGQKTDAIIVLTGGNSRVEEGLALLNRGTAPKIFISGVHQDVQPEEILGMSNDTPSSSDVELGYEATTTQQNGEETRDWIEMNEISSVRLVTNNYHMLRAFMEVKSTSPNVVIVLHPVKHSDHDLNDPSFWKLLFSEYHKVLFRGAQLAGESL